MISLMGLVIAASAMLAGCIEDEKSDALDIVIVSIAPQKEMLESILGADVEVLLMVPENMDPHQYSPTPSQLLKVASADVYFTVGSGIEFEELNLATIKETNPDMEVVDLSFGIDIVSFEDHKGDHDHEDDSVFEVHTTEGTDPHIWLSPYNMKIMAENVLNFLEEEGYDDIDFFRENAFTYQERIDSMIDEIDEMLENSTLESFMTYHAAWGYFADAFGLEQIPVESEGKEPGPQGVADLIEQAKEENITVFLVEPQFDSSSARQIADEIGGSVITADPLAYNYIDALIEIAGKMTGGT